MKIIEDDDFAEFEAKLEAPFVRPASFWKDEYLGYDDPAISGDKLPWIKTHDMIRFRPEEITVWGGYSGSGKSLLLGQAMLHIMKTKRVLIASMEMPPMATIWRMNLQTGMIHDPSLPNPAVKKAFMNWTDDKLWIYDQIDAVSYEKILAMMRYATSKHGIDHIVIDSLMLCGISGDDYNRQKDFVAMLCYVAKKYKTHIHLVCHTRKPDGEAGELKAPTKYQIFGSSDITNLAHNVMVVFRNKAKEIAEDRGEQVPLMTEDAILYIRKNRGGGVEGGIGLYLETDKARRPITGQYNEHPNKNHLNITLPIEA